MKINNRTVYVAGPYSGPIESNILTAISAANECIDCGVSPYCPHLNHHLNRYVERSYEEWMGIDLDWLHRSDALIRLPGESPGADREVAEAHRVCIPVFLVGVHGTISEICSEIEPRMTYPKTLEHFRCEKCGAIYRLDKILPS